MQSISFEQNISAVESAVEQINERFELVGIKCEIRKHKAGRKFSFVHIDCPPNHWVSLAKWLKFEQNVDYLIEQGKLLWSQRTNNLSLDKLY